jgi:uncharacterized protein (TIGR02444 family)
MSLAGGARIANEPEQASTGNMHMTDDTLSGFATSLYADPELATLCLALQDDFGADVTLLLCVTWRSWRDGIALDAAAIAHLDDYIRPWRDQVVAPLRAVRRWLKQGLPPSPAGTSEALRTRVKQAELEAEMIALALLESTEAADHAPRPDAHALQSSLAALARFLASPRIDDNQLRTALGRYEQAVWRRLGALGLPLPASSS